MIKRNMITKRPFERGLECISYVKLFAENQTSQKINKCYLKSNLLFLNQKILNRNDLYISYFDIITQYINHYMKNNSRCGWKYEKNFLRLGQHTFLDESVFTLTMILRT